MANQGDIVCALDDLLLIAVERWRTSFSQHDLARVSGLSLTTINGLMPRNAGKPRRERIAFSTIAALCTVFVCLPGELLRYRAPGVTLAQLSPNAVRRSEPPRSRLPIYPVTNHIPDCLQPYTPATLAHTTGVAWSTWKRIKLGTKQIEFDTLAAICVMLQCDVDHLLDHVAPFRNATWTIRSVQFDDIRLTISLSNGVAISGLLAHWKPLVQATATELSHWHLSSDGQAVRWDALGLEISPRLMLD